MRGNSQKKGRNSDPSNALWESLPGAPPLNCIVGRPAQTSAGLNTLQELRQASDRGGVND